MSNLSFYASFYVIFYTSHEYYLSYSHFQRVNKKNLSALWSFFHKTRVDYQLANCREIQLVYLWLRALGALGLDLFVALLPLDFLPLLVDLQFFAQLIQHCHNCCYHGSDNGR